MTCGRALWVSLGFGRWSWMYSYCPETHIVRARFDGAWDIWRSIFDLRCLTDERVRPAWWRAVRWEAGRIFHNIFRGYR